LAGKPGYGYDEIIKQISKSIFKDDIVELGYITDHDKWALLKKADVFIFPSFYEGFGLPPLEAMSCGTPVISSNTTSIPEVVGDSGILIDPYQDNSLLKAMELMLGSETLRNELSKLSLSRSKLFSWENTARKTLTAYKTVHETVITEL